MRTSRGPVLIATIVTVTSLVGMQSQSADAPEPLGPEVSGLRMGLQISTRYSDGVDHYDVRIRIRNTGSDAIMLVGPAHYEGKANTYAEWLKAEMCFETFPELLPPSAQTGGAMRATPHPQITIAPGEESTVSWTSRGRYLKTEDYYNTTPYFASEGLYSVRARILLHTPDHREILLHSNQQAVSIGGSVTLPKYGVARVIQRDLEKQHVVLSLGARHRIAEGDRFRVPYRFPSGWMLTVTEVHTSSCIATAEKTGLHKEDMEPLPLMHGKAQLWEFGQPSTHREFSRQLSVPELKSIRLGMTRKELQKFCHIDGGISSLTAERYVLKERPADGPEGKVLKIDISFRPAELSEEIYSNPEKFRKWCIEHGSPFNDTDVVMGVSQPYWEPPYCD